MANCIQLFQAPRWSFDELADWQDKDTLPCGHTWEYASYPADPDIDATCMVCRFAAEKVTEYAATVKDVIDREGWLELADPDASPYVPWKTYRSETEALERELHQALESLASHCLPCTEPFMGRLLELRKKYVGDS